MLVVVVKLTCLTDNTLSFCSVYSLPLLKWGMFLSNVCLLWWQIHLHTKQQSMHLCCHHFGPSLTLHSDTCLTLTNEGAKIGSFSQSVHERNLFQVSRSYSSHQLKVQLELYIQANNHLGSVIFNTVIAPSLCPKEPLTEPLETGWEKQWTPADWELYFLAMCDSAGLLWHRVFISVKNKHLRSCWRFSCT